MGMIDALLVLSFGGPESPEDVMPFLQNVTRGRPVPPERLEEVAHHYEAFGGVSPINAANRALIEAVRAELAEHRLDLPVYWGNRNWHPLLADTVRAMTTDGIRHAAVFVTSAYSSYSSCGQYLADLAAARAEVGADAPRLDKLRPFFDHPGFIDPQVDGLRAALDSLGAERRVHTRVVFVAHSVPVAMAAASGPDGGAYVAQLRAAAALVADRCAVEVWDLVFCSRSGSPGTPWLEPDVRDHLASLDGTGVREVVVVPIGFVSDHMEVRWDLDVEAAAVADEHGLGFLRIVTAGSDPRFAAMVRELVQERLDPTQPRRALSDLPPSPESCPRGCCQP
jgi:protoporphyrin/coproporphyrin ferrochelatase